MKINKSFLSVLVYSISIGFLFQGCMQYNVAYTPLVSDCGPQITTRNKYRIADYIMRLELDEIRYAEVGPNWLEQMNVAFASSQPGVFSSAGVPVQITQNHAQFEKLDSWGKFTIFVPFLVSCFTLPFVIGDECCFPIEISVYGGAQINQVKLHCKSTTAMTCYTPIALMLPMDDGYETKPGYRTFHKHGRSVLDDCTQHIQNQALAYGIAVRLKEMEDAGLINTASGNSNVRPAMPLPANPLIQAPASTPRPNPPASAKPIIQRGGNAEVPAHKETSSHAYEVENITFQ